MRRMWRIKAECRKETGHIYTSYKALRARMGPERKDFSSLTVKLTCRQVRGTALKESHSRKRVGVREAVTSVIDAPLGVEECISLGCR